MSQDLPTCADKQRLLAVVARIFHLRSVAEFGRGAAIKGGFSTSVHDTTIALMNDLLEAAAEDRGSTRSQIEAEADNDRT